MLSSFKQYILIVPEIYNYNALFLVVCTLSKTSVFFTTCNIFLQVQFFLLAIYSYKNIKHVVFFPLHLNIFFRYRASATIVIGYSLIKKKWWNVTAKTEQQIQVCVKYIKTLIIRDITVYVIKVRITLQLQSMYNNRTDQSTYLQIPAVSRYCIQKWRHTGFSTYQKWNIF